MQAKAQGATNAVSELDLVSLEINPVLYTADACILHKHYSISNVIIFHRISLLKPVSLVIKNKVLNLNGSLLRNQVG